MSSGDHLPGADRHHDAATRAHGGLRPVRGGGHDDGRPGGPPCDRGLPPTRKYVDAALLRAVTAMGASIYRTHGLGYVLRRSGHRPHLGPGSGLLPPPGPRRCPVARVPAQQPCWSPGRRTSPPPGPRKRQGARHDGCARGARPWQRLGSPRCPRDRSVDAPEVGERRHPLPRRGPDPAVGPRGPQRPVLPGAPARGRRRRRRLAVAGEPARRTTRAVPCRAGHRRLGARQRLPRRCRGR